MFVLLQADLRGNQAFSSLSILFLWTKETMKSTAYISPRMIHIAPMASPASRFLQDCVRFLVVRLELEQVTSCTQPQ